MEKIYTLQEVAEILRVSTRTVTRRVSSGELEGYREGIMWRVPESSLRAYLEKRKQLFRLSEKVAC